MGQKVNPISLRLGINRGEWFGVGLGNGIQKNLYLPEPHTDFIYAVIVEEFGALGGLIIILLFAVLVYGIIITAIKAIELGRMFQGFLAFGAGILISVQAIFNIGVNLGMLPTKGLTLPFISYGGTSLILFMSIFIFFLLRREIVLLITVKVFKPSKSNFTKPAFSEAYMSN